MLFADRLRNFQTKFNAHVTDLGREHVYIKIAPPRLNGIVERPHLTDKREFYQCLDYVDDVDLNQKLAQWESYYNFLRPHSADIEKMPYEKLKVSMLG